MLEDVFVTGPEMEGLAPRTRERAVCVALNLRITPVECAIFSTGNSIASGQMETATQGSTRSDQRGNIQGKDDKGKRRFVRRNSRIHGKGVFARTLIPAGMRLMEYKGERITDKQSEVLYADTTHTFLFMLDSTMVIDGGQNGNTSRWINHSCEPNCEANEEADRVYIDALRNIADGEEITIDYNLYLEERHTAKLKREYACGCGKRRCRGTLLASKR